MAFNDKAVFTASSGYVYTGPVGTAAPTPAQLARFNPESFGAHTHSLKIEGNPTGGTYTLTAGGGGTTAAIKHDASAAEIQAALEKVSAVGIGGALVSGTVVDGFSVSFIGENFGKQVTLTSTANLTGGSAAKVSVAEAEKPLGWNPIGHTAEDDLPEFGYDGGDTETKGSWQKKSLREVVTEAPVDYVTMKPIQFDEETFELYYGKNASSVAGVFGIDNPAAGGVERAILVVIVDGSERVAFSAAKASVRRDESIELSNEEFGKLPIRATFIKHPGRHLFEWTSPVTA